MYIVSTGTLIAKFQGTYSRLQVPPPFPQLSQQSPSNLFSYIRIKLQGNIKFLLKHRFLRERGRNGGWAVHILPHERPETVYDSIIEINTSITTDARGRQCRFLKEARVAVISKRPLLSCRGICSESDRKSKNRSVVDHHNGW